MGGGGASGVGIVKDGGQGEGKGLGSDRCGEGALLATSGSIPHNITNHVEVL